MKYKMEMKNPYPEHVTEEQFQELIKEQMGERGYAVSTIPYKSNRYSNYLDMGIQSVFQVYNPEDGLLYSWQSKSDTVTTLDSKKTMNTLKEVIQLEETETVLGIECNIVLIKTAFGQSKFWYNKNHFKMDPNLYEGHVYGEWEALLKVSNALPIKMETQGLTPPIVLTMIEYKAESVSDKKFVIPEFGTVMSNPMN